MIEAAIFIALVCLYALHSEIKRQQAPDDAEKLQGSDRDVS